MTPFSPYLRDKLLATRAGLTDPFGLVRQWLDEYLALRAVERPSVQQAAELLTRFGRLQRTRPSLLAKVSSFRRWNLDETVIDRCQSLMPQVLAQLDIARWETEAEQLAVACDEAQNEADLRAQAERLLSELDDLDLIAWAASRHGSSFVELEEKLNCCFDWLSNNLDRLFPATIWIQWLGQTLRPDLAGYDLELARTAEKYVLLLDALEEVQQQIYPERPRVALFTDSWAGFPEPPVALAAATTDEEGLFRRYWRSPDGRFVAELIVGPEQPGVSLVRVIFLEGEESGSSLAGQPVWLAGCSATIDGDGRADFDRASLLAAKAAGERLWLLVGEERQAWQLD